MNSHRNERLAVLKDRADRQASEPGDLAEALKLAREAYDESVSYQEKMAENEGWKSLIIENTQQLQRSSDLSDAFEDLLGPISRKEEAKAKFLEMLATPKVFLPLVVLIILLLAGFIGVVTFDPIKLSLPL
jgi:hypothetical protein